MARGDPRFSVGVGRQPFYRWLAAFSASCFVGTLVTDIVYWRTADMMWSDFSNWLLTVGVIVGYVTIIVALIETFAIRPPLRRRPTWPYAVGHVAAAVVLVLVLTGWMTRETYDAAGAEATA